MNKILKLKIFLIFLIIIFLIALAVILINIYLSNRFISLSNSKVNSYPVSAYYLSSYTDEQIHSVFKKYKGNYLEADLPSDWDIVEYSDVNGMDQALKVSNIDYSGFTGFIIKNHYNTLFSLRGIDGVGGNGACSTINKFVDTDPKYIEYEKGKAIAYALGTPIEPKVIDLSKIPYYDTSLFGKKLRRTGEDLYWESSDNFKNNAGTFNPACGLDGSFIKFDGINFIIADSTSNGNGNLYKMRIYLSITVEDEQVLDKVLNSIKFKK